MKRNRKEPCEICQDRISRPALKAYRKEQDLRNKIHSLHGKIRRLEKKINNQKWICMCGRELKSQNGFTQHQNRCLWVKAIQKMKVKK